MPRTRPRTLDDAPHDVLYIIFQNLQPAQLDDVRGSNNQSAPPTGWLLDVALSCKSLSIHALDMLWHTLPSDEPLLYLLDVLNLGLGSPAASGGERTSVVRSGRSLEGADDTDLKWARFRSYACRVRKITLNPCHNKPPVWKRFPSENVCLCSLRTVEVYGIYNQPGSIDTSLLNLIPDSTRALNFRIFSQPEDTLEICDSRISQDVFAILIGLCTRLEDLGAVTIRRPPGEGREAVDLGTLLVKHRLHSITIMEPKLTLDKLQPLCARSTLTSLSFTMLPDAVATMTPLAFKYVQRLDLQGNWKSISAALTSLIAPRVRAIRLVINNPPYASLDDDMASCCADLAYSGFPAVDDIQFVLQDPINLKSPPRSPTGLPMMSVVCRLRRPVTKPFTVPVALLQLRGLRSLSMQYSLHYLNFTHAPDALHPFTKAWPTLENLRLVFPLSRGLPSLGTTLLALAEHCPHLRSVELLAMEYEDGAMERAEAYAARRDVVHGLQELRVRRMGFLRRDDKAEISAMKLALLIFPKADFVLG